jgi:tungstate transport system ATP-binding protein
MVAARNGPSILPLTIEGAQVRRRGKILIGPVSHVIGREGFTIIMGPNGAGKSSFLKMVHGLDRLSRGKVSWNVPLAVARTRQAFVSQTPVMMRRCARDNVAFPLLIHGKTRASARSLAQDWLDRVGLGDAGDRPAQHLSGGEKQKLSLARALIRKPDIVFLDEPCANLDGRATREIEAVLQEAYRTGTRIVMATHDMGQARRLASDVVFIHRGNLHEITDATDFFNSPTTPEARAFLRGDIVE